MCDALMFGHQCSSRSMQHDNGSSDDVLRVARGTGADARFRAASIN